MILDAILYLVRGGVAWRQLPAEFPPPTTVHGIFVRWIRGGRGSASTTCCPTAAIIDFQTVPAADTVHRSTRGRDGGKKTNGRKHHITVDVNGLLLAVVVTAASIQDRDATFRLLSRLRDTFSTIRLVWADGGTPGRLIGWANQVVALPIQIIKRIAGSAGFHVRPRVWCVERTFAWINSAAAASATTKPDPRTTKLWGTSP